jgi:hypothetical protein
MSADREVLLARAGALDREIRVLQAALDAVAQQTRPVVAVRTIRESARKFLTEAYAAIGELEEVVPSRTNADPDFFARFSHLKPLRKALDDFARIVEEEAREAFATTPLPPDGWRTSLSELEERTTRHRRELLGVAHEIKDNPSLDPAGPGLWQAFTAIQSNHTRLLADSFSLLAGAWTRRMQVEQGVFELADRLLRELGRLRFGFGPTVVIPAEVELSIADVSAVTLAFADTTVWNLPVLAHEYGHLFARQTGPVHQFLLADSPSGADWRSDYDFRYRSELFADIFATYTVGAAYACTCVLLRFDPTTAYEEGPQHPSAATRVHAMTRVLATLSTVPATFREQVLSKIKVIWPYEVSEPDLEELNMFVESSLEILMQHVHLLVPSDGLGLAYRHAALVDVLTGDGMDLSDLPEQLNDGSVVELLNAAWESRLRAGIGDQARASQISANLISMCRYWDARTRHAEFRRAPPPIRP